MCMLYGRLGLCRWYCGAVETGTVSVHVNRILRQCRSPIEEDKNAPNSVPRHPPHLPSLIPSRWFAPRHRPRASVAFSPAARGSCLQLRPPPLVLPRHERREREAGPGWRMWKSWHLCYMLPEPYCLSNKHTSLHSQSPLSGISYFSFQSKLLSLFDLKIKSKKRAFVWCYRECYRLECVWLPAPPQSSCTVLLEQLWCVRWQKPLSLYHEWTMLA